MTVIGPNFANELAAAHLFGLPMTWASDGLHNTSLLTSQQLAAVQAVLAAHDPTKPDQSLVCAISSAGAHPNLNGTWSLDATTQFQLSMVALSAQQFGLPRGASTFSYAEADGTTVHALTEADLTLLWPTLRDYDDEFQTALATLIAGGSATLPSQPVQVA